MRAITRGTEDGRRSAELDQRNVQAKFDTTPALKHLKDGQVVVIKDTGELVWRNGKKLYFFTGTEVT